MKILKVSFYSFCALILLIGCLLIGHIKADSPPLIITELKVRNDPTGYDEFIEFYNPGIEPVSLNNYFIGYINTPTPSLSQEFDRSVIGQGRLEAGQYFLLAKNEFDPHLTLAQKSPFGTLADSGGTVQISDEAGAIVDEVHWSSSASMANNNIVYMPGTAQAKSQSITRGKTLNSYNITLATWQITAPTPESSTLLPLLPELVDPVDQGDPPPEVLPNVSDQNDSDDLPGTTQTAPSRSIEITELLPNPANPSTDESDEFIELHNVSSEAINVKNYKLQSGNTFTYSYTFPDHTIQADTYVVFAVSTTHLLLSNVSGRSRLLNATGEVISQTEPYGAAPAGKAWALIDDVWQWTDNVTPGAANIASFPSSSPKANGSTPKINTHKAVKATKMTSAKSSKTVAAKTKATNTPKKSNTPKSNKTAPSSAQPAGKLHPFILAGVAVGTVLYGLYEYRQDIGNTVRRLRSNRSIRRELGSQAQGARGD